MRGRPKGSADGVRRVQWSGHPEWQEFMAGLDHEHMSRAEVSDAFEERWGFPLSAAQVGYWRSENGRCDPHRASHRGGRRRRPVGYERESKDGYIMRKVREEADVPCTKDNWMLKQQWVWEQANGRELPEGHVVYFADGDNRNFDPANLVAVPRTLVGILNNPATPGFHDAEGLRACLALCELQHAAREAERQLPRRCFACGEPFTPGPGQAPDAKNCAKCLEAGRAARKPCWER